MELFIIVSIQLILMLFFTFFMIKILKTAVPKKRKVKLCIDMVLFKFTLIM